VNEIRAVLLDLYDTLAWTEWPAMRGELERRFGLSEPELLRAYSITRPARSVGAFGSAEGDVAAILEAAGVPADGDLVRELAARTASFLEGAVHLWDDVIPSIRKLRSRGLRTALVSNCDHSTRPVVEALGLVAETDATILSFEVGVAKPDPGIYRAALERVDVEPGEAVFVDDQARYCDGAAAVGIATFLIARADATPAEGRSETGGHRVIRDLRALPDLVSP
jgi:putative hydrolase of the HAD superfamily